MSIELQLDTDNFVMKTTLNLKGKFDKISDSPIAFNCKNEENSIVKRVHTI